MDFKKDYYRFPQRLYFDKVMDTVVEIASLDVRNIRVLDFGCGHSHLKKRLGWKVKGYDIIPELSEVKDWRKVKFNVIVANVVFYLMEADELRAFLTEAKKLNGDAELVVVMSRHTLLNDMAAKISRLSAAHSGAKMSPKEQLDILLEYCEIIRVQSVLGMCDIYHMQFIGEEL